MGKIKNFYKSTIEEASIDSYGYNFLCIYGSHINGNYIAIINWGVSAELSLFPNDITYNAMRIAEVLEKIPQTKANASNMAYDIANAIAPRLKEMYDKEKNKNNEQGITKEQEQEENIEIQLNTIVNNNNINNCKAMKEVMDFITNEEQEEDIKIEI